MLLILETITWKPHIETAIEIALGERDAGRAVMYCNLRKGLPVCEDQSAIHALLDLPESRVARARRLLENEGIPFLAPGYDAHDRDKALAASRALIDACVADADIKRLSYGDFPDIGWGALSSTASVRKDSTITLANDRELLRKYLAASILVYEKTRELIDSLRPEAIMLFNGRFATTRAAMRAAEVMGVPWKIHERGADKRHYWVTDCLPHDLDRIQQLIRERFDPERSTAGHAFFRARRDRIERAWHAFARHQEQGRLPMDMRDGDEWITFFTSSEDEMIAIGDRFENVTYPTQESAIQALAAAVATIPGLRLCVRIHPHIALKSERDRRKWQALELPGVVVVGPSDKVDTYALIDRSKVVCTYGSTVGVEATYWGRPSLLFGRSYYDQLGVCTLAEDAAQIRSFLLHPTVSPQASALPYGAFWETLGTPYRYYRAETLHGGTICGVDLDSGPMIRAAKWLSARLLPAQH
jgi:hypothetical protein